MRLRKNQQQAIRKTVREIFGPDAAVYVFGSRVDDSARGGDIDLLIRLESPQVETERKILQLVARLQIRLGDQPIDELHDIYTMLTKGRSNRWGRISLTGRYLQFYI